MGDVVQREGRGQQGRAPFGVTLEGDPVCLDPVEMEQRVDQAVRSGRRPVFGEVPVRSGKSVWPAAVTDRVRGVAKENQR